MNGQEIETIQKALKKTSGFTERQELLRVLWRLLEEEANKKKQYKSARPAKVKAVVAASRNVELERQVSGA